jgi:hypothetical protein
MKGKAAVSSSLAALIGGLAAEGLFASPSMSIRIISIRIIRPGPGKAGPASHFPIISSPLSTLAGAMKVS